MEKKNKREETTIIEKREEKAYSAEELLKLGKEKNHMDFAKIQRKE